MAGTGGVRDGAGRKPGAKNKSTMEVKTLLDKIVDWKVLVEKLVELSNGISVVKFNEKGQQKVYENPPDSHAAKILMEYRFGKPQQSINHSGQITEIVVKKTIIKKNV